MPLLIVGVLFELRRLAKHGLARAVLRDARTWLGVFVLCWQFYYFTFMIPKIGPTRDVDLFWPTFTVTAFLAGRLLDASDRPRLHFALLCAVAGSAIVTTVYLSWIGLPRRF